MFDILLYILMIFITLFGLFSLGRRSSPMGETVAETLALLVRWMVWLTLWLQERRRDCVSIFKDLLKELKESLKGLAATTPGTASTTGVLIARVFWFLVVGGLIAGETYNVLAAIPALFKVAYPNLGSFFIIASACLFICPALAFGGIFLEVVGITFTYDPLFPFLDDPNKKRQRWGLGVGSLIGLILSLIVVYQFFQYRALYLDPTLRQSVAPLDVAHLTINIFDVLAVTVFLAIALLWHIFIKGMEVVFVLLIGLLSLFLFVLAFILNVIPLTVEQITLSLSNGKISPYHHLQHQNPIASRSFQPDVFQVSVVFAGAFGSDAFNPFITRFPQNFVSTYAFLDQLYDPAQASKRRINARKNISPDRRQLEQYYQKSSEEFYKGLFKAIGHKQVEEHADFHEGVLLYILDCHTLKYAKDMLTDVRKGLPNYSLLVLTSVSDGDKKKSVVTDGLNALEALQKAGTLANIILIDSASPFVNDDKHNGEALDPAAPPTPAGTVHEPHGQEVQLEFVAHSIMGLLTAYIHRGDGLRNPTVPQMLANMKQELKVLAPGKEYPYLGFSFVSRKLEGSSLLVANTLEEAKDLTAKEVILLPPPTPSAVGATPGAGAAPAGVAPGAGAAPGLGAAPAGAATPPAPITSAPTTRAYKADIITNHPLILLCHIDPGVWRRAGSFARFSSLYRSHFENEGYIVAFMPKKGTWYTEIEHEPPVLLQVTCFYPFEKY